MAAHLQRAVVGLVCLALALSALAASALSEDFAVENIQRRFSLARPHGVDITLSFKATRKSNSAASFQILTGSEASAGSIAKLACTVNSERASGVEQTTTGTGLVAIKVPLPSSFTSGTISCDLLRVGRGARRPFPKEILQLEKQRFVFDSETVRAEHAYKFVGQEASEVILPRGKIDLLAEAPKCAVAGNRVSCGPYTAPPTELDNVPLRVQYDADFAFPVAKYVEREIEISHWGNVAVEEHLDVHNDGATLKGEFSRLDHQAHEVRHAFQHLKALLPADAWGVYYRDELGNVTTSHMFKPKNKKATELELKLRFPLYGGWHIEWYHGYNVPLTSFVSKVQGTNDRYLLECDLAQPIDILAETLVVHVVLPPGATNVKVESPVKSRIVEEKTFRRYTYLDVPWTARNVLSLELRNVLGEPGAMSAESRLRVYYSYSDYHIIEKPLTISATLFAVLAAYMLFGRISNK